MPSGHIQELLQFVVPRWKKPVSWSNCGQTSTREAAGGGAVIPFAHRFAKHFYVLNAFNPYKNNHVGGYYSPRFIHEKTGAGR